MEATHPTVALGTRGREVDVPVIAQPHTFLVRQVEAFMQRAAAAEALGALLDGASPVEAIGLLVAAGDSLLYDVLVVFLPDMPRRLSKHEFAGFRTAEGFELDDYVPDDDHSPSIPQLEEAFKVAARINRFDIFKVLIGPLKGMVGADEKAELKNWIRRQFKLSWPSSPGTSGESSPEPSTATAPTAANGNGSQTQPTAAGHSTDGTSPVMAGSGELLPI